MRDIGRMILHEIEVIIPFVAVALDSVLSIGTIDYILLFIHVL